MASPALEAQVRALSVKMEGEAKTAIADIEKMYLRPVERKTYACLLKCLDDAGNTGSPEQLQHCKQKCQGAFQLAQSIVQQEVGEFQERINRSMMQCQDEAKDLMTADIQANSRQMKKVEDKIVACMTKTVDHHINALGPLKRRVADQMKKM